MQIRATHPQPVNEVEWRALALTAVVVAAFLAALLVVATLAAAA